MKRWIVVALCAIAGIAISLDTVSLNSLAQVGSPVAIPIGSPIASPVGSPVASPVVSPEVEVPVADLEGELLDLQATVSAQSDDIAALQTQVANLSAVAETPEADLPGEAELHDVTVTIVLRARADEMIGEALGDACAGAGRWADLGPDTQITLNDPDETFGAGATADTTEIVFSGRFFRECRLTYSLTDVPTVDEYVFVVKGRTQMTLSLDEMVAADWSIDLTFGP